MNMKTISFKLLKRLNDEWYLDNIETEYCLYSTYYNEEDFQLWRYNNIEENEYYRIWQSDISEYKVFKKYKALTLEEAIKILPKMERKNFVDFKTIYRTVLEDWKYLIEYAHYKSAKNYLPLSIDIDWIEYIKNDDEWNKDIVWNIEIIKSFSWNSEIEIIEQMIIYLLDNNLLWHK